MKINKIIKTAGLVFATSITPIYATNNQIKAPEQDIFLHEIPAEGTSASSILEHAPSPEIIIKGKRQSAAIVVDISKNTLYKYNKEGKAEKAYLVASGKSQTPTKKGVSIVSHIESFPYKNAPIHTKRRKNPYPYGPQIIILDKLTLETGERLTSGQWIHGNNNASCLGKHVSHGCVRMDNEVIKKLSKEVERGDIVIFK